MEFVERYAPRAKLIILALACGTGWACSGEHVSTTVDPQTGRYSTSFPRGDRSSQLVDALPGVRMLSSVSFYRQASFDAQDAWPADQPVTDRVWRVADTVTTFSESVVGSGIILQFSDSRIALLTSAHVVTFDDTVTTYYHHEGEPVGISAFAVKVRQRNFVAEVPGADALEVLARDDRLDIAIVGQTIDTRDTMIPVFPLPVGKADDLAWGSFVYSVGYPVGLRMVSSGTVSQPNRDKDGSFLTDIAFNRGMSGAAVLAARSHDTTLEWVGVVTSGAASTEYLLTPDVDQLYEGSTSGEPYEGTAYASRVKRIRYGVSMAVSVDAVKQLAEENRAVFRRRGYHLSILN